MAVKTLLYLLIAIELLMMTTCVAQEAPAGDQSKESSVEQVGNTTTEVSFSALGCIAVDQQDNLYLAELSAGRVRKFP